MTYKVTVFDEVDGGYDVLTVNTKTLEIAIYLVESDPLHEYEIIEIEKV